LTKLPLKNGKAVIALKTNQWTVEKMNHIIKSATLKLFWLIAGTPISDGNNLLQSLSKLCQLIN